MYRGHNNVFVCHKVNVSNLCEYIVFVSKLFSALLFYYKSYTNLVLAFSRVIVSRI